MKTKEFLSLLDQNPDKELVFELGSGAVVPVSYHITEVKNAHIRSVDCGGRPDEYFQTIVQLWVDPSEKVDSHLKAGKAGKIFDKVDRIHPIRKSTEILFEWGDKQLPTSTYVIDRVDQQPDKMVVRLSVPPTVCKPRLDLEALGNAIGNKLGCCS